MTVLETATPITTSSDEELLTLLMLIDIKMLELQNLHRQGEYVKFYEVFDLLLDIRTQSHKLLEARDS